MKIKRINKSKFFRNILICVIVLFIVAFIINTAPGYKRDKYGDVINLIINEENKTEELKNDIYINENGTIYMSEEDVRLLLDSTLYYDEQYNKIITISDTKVASISIDENKMSINDSNIKILDTIIKINDKIYLPISDMAIVYNIKVSYIKDTNRVIIDDLNKGMIMATVTEDTKIKFRPKRLSKNIGTLEKGQIVSCFYTTSKGWRQIRTSDGTVGYIKANKLTNEEIIRQDMEKRQEGIKITYSDYINKIFNIKNKLGENKQIVLRKILNINEGKVEDTEETNNTWIVISNEDLGNESNVKLQDYEKRKELIEKIVNIIIENEADGISIEFDGTARDNMYRFVIELVPRLREIGKTTCLVLNDSSIENYINVVDYVVE